MRIFATITNDLHCPLSAQGACRLSPDSARTVRLRASASALTSKTFHHMDILYCDDFTMLTHPALKKGPPCSPNGYELWKISCLLMHSQLYLYGRFLDYCNLSGTKRHSGIKTNRQAQQPPGHKQEAYELLKWLQS